MCKLEGITVSLETNFKGLNALHFEYKGKEKFVHLRDDDYDSCLVALHDLGME